MAGPIDDADTLEDQDDLHARIAEIAYRRAEQRGFQPGYELEDWVEAEKIVKGALLPEREPGELPDETADTYPED